MSLMHFNLVIDWVMRRATEDDPRGIRWTVLSTLEVLDFADDLMLLSSAPSYAREDQSTLHLRKTGQIES